MWGLTSSQDNGVGRCKNQSPGLVSSVLVGEGDGNGDGRSVIHREVGLVNKYINDNESHVSHC